jgi:hypothetical protein
VVPTFTTSNDRMLLLLAEGASGMLRLEDAERLQVGAPGAGAGHRMVALYQQYVLTVCLHMMRGRKDISGTSRWLTGAIV